jgi:hypothetical protein
VGHCPLQTPHPKPCRGLLDSYQVVIVSHREIRPILRGRRHKVEFHAFIIPIARHTKVLSYRRHRHPTPKSEQSPKTSNPIHLTNHCFLILCQPSLTLLSFRTRTSFSIDHPARQENLHRYNTGSRYVAFGTHWVPPHSLGKKIQNQLIGKGPSIESIHTSSST